MKPTSAQCWFATCPDCEFSDVFPVIRDGSVSLFFCKLCADDSGHLVEMTTRPATDADRPEGFDARKHDYPQEVL